ncbi:hypothetical protein T069G_04714 [Trichoderma breve]|uniref:Uncharacterized protein n=1 Tax=Trichoderma breve TaxID=2034170 RepID=A0A9W9BH67_9HYPO|nr:hypothetical protein T069G_04714 [Trichoderma breve]KAJ4859726.1 hypothetical protein T069G_04714 [Trichoderma breve]
MALAVGSGIFISNTGLATPIMVGGSAIATLGCGLCYLFDLNTRAGVWIGIQIIVGIGLGSATAMILCFQTIGGAIWVSASQSVFINRMLIAVSQFAPGVDPKQVVSTGAGELRKVFGSDELLGIISAYLTGIRAAYLLCCAVAGASLLVGVFLPWNRLDTDALKEVGGAAA